VGRAFLWVISSTLSLAWAAAVRACPDCPASRAAREQVLDQGLGARLLVAVLPFAVVGLVSRLAERIGRR
jgi:hypothetical protein